MIYISFAWPLNLLYPPALVYPGPPLAYEWLWRSFFSIVFSTWPYTLAILITWILFSRYQFVRVWFHLVSFYGIVLMVMIWIEPQWIYYRDFSFSHWTGYLAVKMHAWIPYVFAGAALLSYLKGRGRSCPACKTLYGKALLSYQKAGSSTHTHNYSETMQVGAYKREFGHNYSKVVGRNDGDLVQVNRTQQVTWYHYETDNICKKCGNNWKATESHTQWWYRPM